MSDLELAVSEFRHAVCISKETGMVSESSGVRTSNSGVKIDIGLA